MANPGKLGRFLPPYNNLNFFQFLSNFEAQNLNILFQGGKCSQMGQNINLTCFFQFWSSILKQLKINGADFVPELQLPVTSDFQYFLLLSIIQFHKLSRNKCSKLGLTLWLCPAATKSEILLSANFEALRDTFAFTQLTNKSWKGNVITGLSEPRSYTENIVKNVSQPRWIRTSQKRSSKQESNENLEIS